MCSVDPFEKLQYSIFSQSTCFNVAERWARDVSEEVAEEIQRRCDLQLTDVPDFLQDFIDRHANRDRRQLTLRLV